MKKYCGITFLLFSLLFIACKSDSTSSATANSPSKNVDKEDQPVSPITKLENEYPQQFKDLSIPLMKGAEIQRADKHNHNTGDKFQISFTSNKTPKEIEEYYLETMKKKGWKVTNYTRSPRKLGAYFSICNNGEKQLLVNSVSNEDNTKTTSTMILMPIPNLKKKE